MRDPVHAEYHIDEVQNLRKFSRLALAIDGHETNLLSVSNTF